VGQSGRSVGAQPAAPVAVDRWNHPVITTIAVRGEGVNDLVMALDRHHEWLNRCGMLAERRRQRLLDRTREVVDRATRRWLWDETRAEQLIADRLDELVAGRLSPYDVASEVLEGLKQGERI
jgi:LAO/AO transport system kinase